MLFDFTDAVQFRGRDRDQPRDRPELLVLKQKKRQFVQGFRGRWNERARFVGIRTHSV